MTGFTFSLIIIVSMLTYKLHTVSDRLKNLEKEIEKPQLLEVREFDNGKLESCYTRYWREVEDRPHPHIQTR